jgi:hypothetical protein
MTKRYIELIFEKNCKLSQGDKSQYFFIKASNVNKNDKLNLPRQFKCFKENETSMFHSMFGTYKWMEVGITPC